MMDGGTSTGLSTLNFRYLLELFIWSSARDSSTTMDKVVFTLRLLCISINNNLKYVFTFSNFIGINNGARS